MCYCRHLKFSHHFRLHRRTLSVHVMVKLLCNCSVICAGLTAQRAWRNSWNVLLNVSDLEILNPQIFYPLHN
jgi:hypothetical protein